jgi:hypothetical protein
MAKLLYNEIKNSTGLAGEGTDVGGRKRRRRI